MMKIINKTMPALFAAMSLMATACGGNSYDIIYPDDVPSPKYLYDVPGFNDGNKAPLYWSVYEACWDQVNLGIANENKDFTPEQWDEVIDMMATKFLPHGYDMICTDGFIPMLRKDGSIFTNYYGSQSIAELVAKAKAKGLRVGVYDNPTWGWVSKDTDVPGTSLKLGDLLDSRGVMLASSPGMDEYMNAYFKHFHDLGVEYLRIDYLCWYENGFERKVGQKAKPAGRDEYALMLYYVAKYAQKYGIYVSLVMPNLFNDAEVERKYGNLTRMEVDTNDGGWGHTSAQNRGIKYPNWPTFNNVFDGMVYWSHISGRDKIRLDGDFIRLNKFKNDDEKMFTISINLVAGGPVTIADKPSTVIGNEKFYTNDEMLALNHDGFVGHPLSDKLGDPDNQIWYGQMSNGDWIVALFNRDDETKSYDVALSRLGISGSYKCRDLWAHADEGTVSAVKADVPAHGCKVVRLTK